jgi:hypothetical protein
MNKKGIAELLLVQSVYGGLVTALVIASVALTPSHRIRKGEQKCLYYGSSASVCKAEVAAMSKADLLAYIRDTQESPSAAWDK